MLNFTLHFHNNESVELYFPTACQALEREDGKNNNITIIRAIMAIRQENESNSSDILHIMHEGLLNVNPTTKSILMTLTASDITSSHDDGNIGHYWFIFARSTYLAYMETAGR